MSEKPYKGGRYTLHVRSRLVCTSEETASKQLVVFEEAKKNERAIADFPVAAMPSNQKIGGAILRCCSWFRKETFVPCIHPTHPIYEFRHWKLTQRIYRLSITANGIVLTEYSSTHMILLSEGVVFLIKS